MLHRKIRHLFFWKCSNLHRHFRENGSWTLLYAKSISAWSNQGSVIYFLSILNQ